jgi:hypothetical protein
MDRRRRPPPEANIDVGAIAKSLGGTRASVKLKGPLVKPIPRSESAAVPATKIGFRVEAIRRRYSGPPAQGYRTAGTPRQRRGTDGIAIIIGPYLRKSHQNAT